MDVVILTAIIATAVVILVENLRLFGGEPPIVQIDTVVDESQMDETDREMVDKSRDVIYTHLGDKPVDALLSLPLEDRVKAVNNMIEELVKLYRIEDELKGLQYEDLGSVTCGFYNYDQKIIRINARFIQTNDREALRNLLLTLFHEIRHAVQKSIVMGNDLWNKDDGWRMRIARNLNNYVPSSLGYELYRNQLVEVDADTFAILVLKGEFEDEKSH